MLKRAGEHTRSQQAGLQLRLSPWELWSLSTEDLAAGWLKVQDPSTEGSPCPFADAGDRDWLSFVGRDVAGASNSTAVVCNAGCGIYCWGSTVPLGNTQGAVWCRCSSQRAGGCLSCGRWREIACGSGPDPRKTCTVRVNSNSWFLLCERN